MILLKKQHLDSFNTMMEFLWLLVQFSGLLFVVLIVG